VAVPVARQYVVVARRYRPQGFEELIGQEHVAQALSNAIATNRVGHAYLFTGARGVGKTSAARIFAKALNCVDGPAAVPCNRCDICQSISAGNDVDVLEIDGASNRLIEDIRQLRQNVNVRPSRARSKIYIIDEVHMLTREAYNALLKTLEEPPEHVRFIFCTTEPTKIPITILSRCQRFDFAGISTRSIFERLRQIVAAEGVQAEPEALEVIARRAAGSMRDSQSLLEQLLAFAPGRITVADVHALLGTAGEERLSALVGHLVARNAAAALAELDAAAHEGVDLAQLVEQLFGYFRDCMLAAVGGPADALLYAAPGRSGEVAEAGKRLGLQTILAAMQILDQTLSRMRVSTQARVLAELALVRICHLEELDELADWVAQLQSGQGPQGPAAASPGEKKNADCLPPQHAASVRAGTVAGPAQNEPTGGPTSPATQPVGWVERSEPHQESGPGPAGPAGSGIPAVALTEHNAADCWNRALERLSGMIVEQARNCRRVTLCGPNRLLVAFAPDYALAKAVCQRPEPLARFERALAEVTGQATTVEFIVEQAEGGPEVRPPAAAIPPQQRIQEIAKHPMIRRAAELFGAQPVSVEEGQPAKQ
jgi:DNA polymerase-3 subunit gamma/tau